VSNPMKKGMHLLVVALNDDTYLENVTLGLTTVSGGQVTMVDGVSGAQNLSRAIPMFAEFLGMGGKRFCKVLMTCTFEPEPARRLLEELNEGGLDFIGLGIGEIYAVPLSEAVIIENVDIF